MTQKNKLGKGKNIFKRFSGLLSQLIFFLISLLIIALLVYVIVAVLLKDIAKIVGVDGGAQSGKESYQFLRDLSSSGYDAMLNAEELIEYHAFEYAVLMDAARFLEETGTQQLSVTNVAKIDIEQITYDSINNREQWALLAAAALCKLPGDADSAFAEGKYAELGLDEESLMAGAEEIEEAGGTSGSDEERYEFEIDTSRGFNTEHTAENLFYRPIYNEYTKENSLYPYLEITREYDIVRYYIESRESTVEALRL